MAQDTSARTGYAAAQPANTGRAVLLAIIGGGLIGVVLCAVSARLWNSALDAWWELAIGGAISATVAAIAAAVLPFWPLRLVVGLILALVVGVLTAAWTTSLGPTVRIVLNIALIGSIIMMAIIGMSNSRTPTIGDSH